MDNNLDLAIEIHQKSTETLEKDRIKLFDRLLALGANDDDLIALSAITAELTIRGIKEYYLKETGTI